MDSGGQPVTDAEILIDWMESAENSLVDTRSSPTVIRGDVPGAPGASLLLLRSDANGRFATDRVGARINASVFDFAGLRATRLGYLPVGRQPVESFANEDGLRIRLDRGAAVTGQVVDGNSGVPLSGAEVSVGRFVSERRPLILGPVPDGADGPFGRVRSGRSRADGLFEVSAWPGSWDILVRAGGMAQLQLRSVEVGNGGLDVGVVELTRGLSLGGVVLAESGQPVAGARIRVAGSKSRGALGTRDGVSHRFRNALELSSDEQGEFQIEGLPEGARVDLLVGAPGFVPTVVERLSAERPVDVVLRRGASIAGRVRSGGQPARGGASLRSQTGETEMRALLDPNGSFSFEDLAPGRYSVTGSEDAGLKRWRRSLTAVTGEKLELDIELEPEDQDRILHGRVTAGGAGVRGIAVQVGSRSASTAVTGEYRFEGLSSGPHVVWVQPDNGYMPRTRKVRIDGPSRRVDFDISRFRVAGRATWNDGTAVWNGDCCSGPRSTCALERRHAWSTTARSRWSWRKASTWYPRDLSREGGAAR